MSKRKLTKWNAKNKERFLKIYKTYGVERVAQVFNIKKITALNLWYAFKEKKPVELLPVKNIDWFETQYKILCNYAKTNLTANEMRFTLRNIKVFE